MRLLCRAGADVGARYSGPQAELRGMTAAGIAVRARSTKALRALADASRASLDAPQGVVQHGAMAGAGAPLLPPLWHAIDAKSERLAHVLLDLGASAAKDVAGPGGETLVQLAQRHGLHGPGSLVQRLKDAAAGQDVTKEPAEGGGESGW